MKTEHRRGGISLERKNLSVEETIPTPDASCFLESYVVKLFIAPAVHDF